MPSDKKSFGVYRDVITERYQDNELKNAKEEDSNSKRDCV